LLTRLLDLLPERKQRRRYLRCGGNLLQLRVMLAERLGYVHFRSFQHANKLQRIDHRFAQIVIIRDHEHGASSSAEYR
jgi:hypothetical protein